MEKLLQSVKKIIPDPILDAVRPAYHTTLAVLAALVYRFPGRKLVVVGVTGTNGKSTTGNFIASILTANGHSVGLTTTVNFQVGRETWLNQTKMTSLGRFAQQRLLRQMVKAGCTHAVVEVSSHALYWKRVWGIPFDVAVLTNLSRDHLDLHGSMKAYRETKGKLFAGLMRSKRKLGVKKSSAVNLDDKEAKYFLSFPADQRFGFTEHNAKVDANVTRLRASKVRSSAKETAFVLSVGGEPAPAKLHLPGAFNVQNALAASAAGYALGVELPEIVTGLDQVKEVPGRMEQVDAGQPFSVVVDYAHTPDAFANVLAALKPITKGKLIAVFGATGDRDRGKRPELGAIAAQYADRLILTEEDPGSENPADIVDEITPGITKAKRKVPYEIELDRRKAISKALAKATSKDTVVLLAKGHETVMTYADGKRPWDDRKVAAEEWRKLAAGDSSRRP